MPNISGSREGILQFTLKTLASHLYFSDNHFAPPTTKISQKIEKTVFLDQFQTAPLTFSLSLPRITGLVRYIVISLSALVLR